MLRICFLGLGSNLGDRKRNIALALEYLNEHKGIKVEKVSAVIETVPILPQGAKPQRKFLNAVVKIKTSLSAQDLLATLKQIERRIGRRPAPRFSPRVIDLDILLYGDEKIDEENLKIPHPQIQERKFVRELLEEVGYKPQANKPQASGSKPQAKNKRNLQPEAWSLQPESLKPVA